VEESEYVGEFQLPSLALSVSSVLPSSCRLNLTRDPVLEMLDHITSLLDDFERYWMILQILAESMRITKLDVVHVLTLL